MSSAVLPIPSEADQKVAEKVCYQSTGAGSVYLNQNADYEAGNIQVKIYTRKQHELHI